MKNIVGDGETMGTNLTYSLNRRFEKDEIRFKWANLCLEV